jgi:hypothetical protein
MQFAPFKPKKPASAICYAHRPPGIPARPLIRFVEFCSALPQSNMKLAWKTFQRSAGKDASAGQISLQQVYYYFPAADFYRMQFCLRSVAGALAETQMLKQKVTAQIERRFSMTKTRK